MALTHAHKLYAHCVAIQEAQIQQLQAEKRKMGDDLDKSYAERDEQETKFKRRESQQEFTIVRLTSDLSAARQSDLTAEMTNEIAALSKKKSDLDDKLAELEGEHTKLAELEREHTEVKAENEELNARLEVLEAEEVRPCHATSCDLLPIVACTPAHLHMCTLAQRAPTHLKTCTLATRAHLLPCARR
jgi:DNA repair exonuclease SbcCD ATPase subunit